MSVTFHPTLGPIDHFIVECLNCNVTHDEQFASYEDASAFILAIREGNATVTGCKAEDYYCEDAAFTQSREAIGQLPEVNVANSNAKDILDVLGVNYRYDTTPEERERDLFGIAGCDLTGSLDAQDFMGRVLTALAVAPESAEVLSHAAVGAPNVIHGGREAGYVQRILRELHEVAQFAIDHDRQITWG